jgi:cytochrome c peroxidase
VPKPIQDPNELDLTLAEAAARVSMTPEEIPRALACYVRSIFSGNSPFDRYINGDRTALSSEQQAGLQVFRGKANCKAAPERLSSAGPWTPERAEQ